MKIWSKWWSKWGRIKIQDNHPPEARTASTKFCSDPFCALSGDCLFAPPHHRLRIFVALCFVQRSSRYFDAFGYQQSFFRLSLNTAAVHILYELPLYLLGKVSMQFQRNVSTQAILDSFSASRFMKLRA
jgi:hypothetical protein